MKHSLRFPWLSLSEGLSVLLLQEIEPWKGFNFLLTSLVFWMRLHTDYNPFACSESRLSLSFNLYVVLGSTDEVLKPTFIKR